MAEREPTVIERMVTKYINTLNHQPEDCRDATLAMLAAVRELYRCQIERGEKYHCMSAACMLEVIEDHERRAGGEGE